MPDYDRSDYSSRRRATPALVRLCPWNRSNACHERIRDPVASDAQRQALGAFIRSQRELANLSLRRMATLAQMSNPYLSQIERGLHEPSVHILRSIAQALNLSAETLLEQAGLLGVDATEEIDTERAIRADAQLTGAQKQALLAVYRSYRATNEAGSPRHPKD
jgi:transcriptional regulator with XRE-family HTH domain